MSVRYLLSCPCGETVTVGPSQAGGSAACGCGRSVDVPRLRELRDLPVEAVQAKAKSGWSFRMGVLSAGLLLAGALAAGAGWFAVNEPEPPAPFDPATRQAIVEQGLEQMEPAGLWRLLVEVYEPAVSQGFRQAESPRDEFINRAIGLSQQYQRALLIAAAAVAVLTAILFAVSPK